MAGIRALRHAFGHKLAAATVALVTGLFPVAWASRASAAAAVATPNQAAAKPDTRIGELPERRTATSATRRNPDMSMTTTVFSTPVHYRAADGSFQPIDPTLHGIDEG